MRLDFVESGDSIYANAAVSLPASVSASANVVTSIRPEIRNVAIVGFGNSAHALGSYLSLKGHRISYLTRKEEESDREITAFGAFEARFSPEKVSNEWDQVVNSSDTIFIATVATAYRDIAARLAPSLRKEQAVVLFSSKLGGVLEFKEALKEFNAPDCDVIETDALFACRLQPGDRVWVRGVKKWNLYTGCCPESTRQTGARLTEFFPGLVPADNFIHRGLTDFGALTHSLNMIVNMNAIDRGEEYSFYYEGFTRTTIKLLEQMEAEFNAVASRYATSLIPAKELLNRYYGSSTRSLYDALTTVPNYKYSKAPTTLQHRYLIEDVGCTLIPLRQLAELAGVKTPLIDSVICMAGILTDTDFEKEGRTLDKLGLGDKSYEEVWRIVNRGSARAL